MRRENKNNNLLNNSSPQVNVFHHFWEYQDACMRFSQNAIIAVYVQEKAHAQIS